MWCLFCFLTVNTHRLYIPYQHWSWRSWPRVTWTWCWAWQPPGRTPSPPSPSSPCGRSPSSSARTWRKSSLEMSLLENFKTGIVLFQHWTSHEVMQMIQCPSYWHLDCGVKSLSNISLQLKLLHVYSISCSQNSQLRLQIVLIVRIRALSITVWMFFVRNLSSEAWYWKFRRMINIYSQQYLSFNT